MKKILLFFALLMPLMASAATEIDGIYYDLNSSAKTATVTYFAYISSYNSSAYTGSVTIPESFTYDGITYSVKAIKDYAFYYCSSLTEVTIPNSVTSIGRQAFQYCSSLSSVTIPNSVTTIGEATFYSCSGLTSVTIPDGVTSIENYAFYDCTSLEYIICEATSVPSTGSNVFYGVTQSSVTLCVPSSALSDYRYTEPWRSFGSIKEIKSGSCGENVNYSLNLGTGVLKITGTGAMETSIYSIYSYTDKNYIKSVVIEDGVTSIGQYAFYDCSGLTSVTIPNSVTEIGRDAFYKCSSLTSVTIPNGVTVIEREVFEKCSSLTSITIPNSVTEIKAWAFCDCSSLTSVTIGNGVTSIGNYAFDGCSSLTFFNIPNSVTSIGILVFNNTAWYDNQPDGLIYAGKIAYKYKGTMPNNTSIDIIEGTLGIAGAAFANIRDVGFTVTIPNSVISIGMQAFSGSGLTSLTIGNGVTSIRLQAFYNCGLTSVHITDLAAWCNISFENYDSNPLSYAKHLYMDGIEITDLTIPNSVKAIKDYAFYGCKGLTSITIPNSVTSIGDHAFYECSKLTDVYCYAENAPTTGSNVFYEVPTSSATLHVPAASLEAYKNTSPWSGFRTIVTLEPMPKCATPSISYADGKVVFNCETEDVEFVAKVTCPTSGEGDYEASSIPLTTTYVVNVYAKKEGYEDSDVAMMEIELGGSTAKKGDVNEDGTVNGTDIQEIINIILNPE